MHFFVFDQLVYTSQLFLKLMVLNIHQAVFFVIYTLPSGKDNDGIDVYAIYPRKNGQPDVLGKLTVMSYSMKRPRVVLVPVNGNDLDAAKVKEELDNVYLPVAVDWQVSTDNSNFSASADSLDVTRSGLFSQYTPGMKKLNNAFVAHKKTDFDASAIYLFVLQYSDKVGATGDMPRSKQFGYLFTKTALAGGEKALYRTIAHEIAHGAFHLNHTFDSNYQIAEGTTNNLMDYQIGPIKHFISSLNTNLLVNNQLTSNVLIINILSIVSLNNRNR